MSPAHRLLLKWSRLLHVYLTLFGFVLLFFFAATGLMLNHEDLFSPAEPQRSTMNGLIPAELLREPDRLGVVERLRKEFGARGEVDGFEVEKELETIRVKFKAPSYFAEAVIKTEEGEVEITHESRGVVGILLDLHRGKTSGEAWSLVIDGVSILFVFVSITGLILWSSLRSRAQAGLLVLILGAVSTLGVYFVWVPR